MAAEKENAAALAKMDEAAAKAKAELATFPDEHVANVQAWWKRHFGAAGHKRLARVLMEYGK